MQNNFGCKRRSLLPSGFLKADTKLPAENIDDYDLCGLCMRFILMRETVQGMGNFAINQPPESERKINEQI